jgi:hypothetical protein
MSKKFFVNPVPDRLDSKVVPFKDVKIEGDFQWNGKTYVKMFSNSKAKNARPKNGSGTTATMSFNDKVEVTITI